MQYSQRGNGMAGAGKELHRFMVKGSGYINNTSVGETMDYAGPGYIYFACPYGSTTFGACQQCDTDYLVVSDGFCVQYFCKRYNSPTYDLLVNNCGESIWGPGRCNVIPGGNPPCSGGA